MGYYYNIEETIEKYPDAWLYMVVGGRNTGKTYSTLKMVTQKKKSFAFIKRTDNDIKLLCAGTKGKMKVDLSPFKSINRDLGTNIQAFSIFDGLGGFYNCDENDEPIGYPVGYAISLNQTAKAKGFDISEVDYMIFDEFIKQPWEKNLNKKEGEAILDLYKTISRDREHRGREPLKLIALANATDVSNPLMQITELVDIVVEMQALDIQIKYIEERGIVIERVNDNPNFLEVEKQTKLFKAMQLTQWAQMAYDNQFAYNDFSNIKKNNLKNYQPVCAVQFKQTIFYIYKKDNIYYACRSKHQAQEFYNLNLENDQKLFYENRVIDFRYACIHDKMKFDSFLLYDIIINYKSYFKI